MPGPEVEREGEVGAEALGPLPADAEARCEPGGELPEPDIHSACHPGLEFRHRRALALDMKLEGLVLPVPAIEVHERQPHALARIVDAAPLHKHTPEDEYSFVLGGRMGALLGEEVVYAGTGDLVFKPRDQWHTFWNAGDEPCRILEIISPAGFEKFFDELVDLTSAGPLDPSGLPELGARYGLEANMESIPGLCERFGVTFGPERGAQRALARRAPSCLEDGEVPIELPLGDLNPVVLPLLPLDLDVAVEDVLAEGAQHELRLGRELDGLAQRLR